MSAESVSAPKQDARTRPPAWRRPAISLAAGLLLTAGILYCVWRTYGLQWAALHQGFSRVSPWGLATLFLLSAAFGLLVGAHKLHLVLRSMGVSIRYRQTLLVRLGSAPARALLPFASGELIQLLYFRSAAQLPLARASGAVVFDKGSNLMGALIWLAVATPLVLRDSLARNALCGVAPLIALALGACLITSAVIVFGSPVHAVVVRWATTVHPWLGRTLCGVLEPFREFGISRKLMFVAYGTLFQARPLVICYVLLAASGLYPGIGAVLSASAAAVCAGYLPGFVAGAGPREAVLLELLRPAGVPAEVGLFVGLMMTLSVNVLPAMLGAPWALWLLRRLSTRPPLSPEQDVE